ncbi:hypothetical protein [Lysinibacter sp. HNR]|uniref:hypothetical protein n=1 Tax=Lysinibacter sp. HNR TaxID=3031408 RepID=UPI002435E14A|nr:hypothetical protein [Lysinibacter sp. HNR]WGD37428.1 hypothetical protein FrondiHNR_00460 [Lysinibacter sp. HNR]
MKFFGIIFLVVFLSISIFALWLSGYSGRYLAAVLAPGISLGQYEIVGGGSWGVFNAAGHVLMRVEPETVHRLLESKKVFTNCDTALECPSPLWAPKNYVLENVWDDLEGHGFYVRDQWFCTYKGEGGTQIADLDVMCVNESENLVYFGRYYS